MSKDDLVSINVSNGVNEEGNPFLTVSAQTEDNRVFLAQMTANEIRQMALGWLEAAEAAEQDAATLRVIRKIDLPDELAGAIIIELRNLRKENG